MFDLFSTQAKTKTHCIHSRMSIRVRLHCVMVLTAASVLFVAVVIVVVIACHYFCCRIQHYTHTHTQLAIRTARKTFPEAN